VSKLRRLVTLGAAIVIGMVVYGYFSLIPPKLKTIDLTGYEVNCSSEERAGKRYMWIKDSQGNIYDSLSRIENCESFVGLKRKVALTYRVSNKTIFGLKVDEKMVLSTEKSLRQRVRLAIYFEAFLSLILLGVGWSVYLEYKKSK